MYPIRHLIALSCLLSSFALAAPATQPVLQWPDGTNAVTIEGCSSKGLLCVPVRVNGSEPLWMLVDTGANLSVVNAKVADQLKLRRVADMNFTAGGGTARTPVALVDTLTIGDPAGAHLNVRPRYMAISDAGSAEMKVDGILGMDVIGETVFTFDFRHFTLTLRQRDGFQPPPGQPEPVKLITRLPAVRCSVAGRESGWFLIDTGNNGRASVGSPTISLLKPDIDPRRVVRSFTFDAQGVHEAYHGVFPSFTLFGRTIDNLPMGFSANYTDAFSRNFAGLIGAGLLHDQRLTIDPLGLRAWLETLELEPAPALKERLLKARPDRMGLTPIMNAIWLGRTDVVKLLIDDGQSPHTLTVDNISAVFMAARHDDLASLRLLLEHKADPGVVAAMGADTALITACENDQPEIVKALLAAGAKPDHPDVYGRTALYAAAEVGATECVRALIVAKADLNKAAKTGSTPLSIAAVNGHKDIVLALLDAGVDPVRPMRVLTSAAASSNTDLVRALLDRGLDVNDRTTDNVTPLMAAALKGQTDNIRLLLERGADASVKSREGKTALDYVLAASSGATDAIRLLIDATPPK